MEFVNGKDDIPYMKWEKTCLKPPTSHGFQDPEVRLDAWWLQNSKMPKISIWASSWCLAGSPVGSDDLGSSGCGKTPVEGWLFRASVCSMFSDTVKQSTGWWYTYPSEKYEFVSWDDEIPNMMGKIIQSCSSHHQPVHKNMDTTGWYPLVI